MHRGFLLFVMWVLVFFETLSLSMSSPFYPPYATNTIGLSLSEVSVVLSLPSLISLLFSFVSGFFLRLPDREIHLVRVGVILECIGSGLFASLEWIEAYALFLSLSVVGSIFIGSGSGFLSTSIMQLITRIYPNDTSWARGIVEFAGGVGIVAAPVVGGSLFEAGGFATPFLVTSSVLVLASIPLLCTQIPNLVLENLSNPYEEESSDYSDEQENIPLGVPPWHSYDAIHGLQDGRISVSNGGSDSARKDRQCAFFRVHSYRLYASTLDSISVSSRSKSSLTNIQSDSSSMSEAPEPTSFAWVSIACVCGLFCGALLFLRCSHAFFVLNQQYISTVG